MIKKVPLSIIIFMLVIVSCDSNPYQQSFDIEDGTFLQNKLINCRVETTGSVVSGKDETMQRIVSTRDTGLKLTRWIRTVKVIA